MRRGAFAYVVIRLYGYTVNSEILISKDFQLGLKEKSLPAGREKVILKEIATRSPAMPRGVTDF
jgi:hypothetical protein